MSWGNSSYFEILGSISSQLEDLSSEVLKNGSSVNCCGGTDPVLLCDPLLEESVDPSDRELRFGEMGRFMDVTWRPDLTDLD